MLRVPDAPPINPHDDATTDALHTRQELLPVAHPIASNSPSTPLSSQRPQGQEETAEDDDSEEEVRTPSRAIWLGIAFIVAVLGTCACCGLAAVLLPPPDWQEHESVKGGFRVDLPAEPRDDMARRVRTQPGRKHDGVEGTFLWTRSENFVVAYRDVAPDLNKSASQFLDDEIAAITFDDNIVKPIDRDEECEIQGFPARKFEYQFRNGGVVTGRVILAGQRVYVLVAGGRFTSSGDENVELFLDSFRITDPAILRKARKPNGEEK
ncbi:MAG: hypothetical protein U0792_00845 [Gemmataceae bacterium]